MKKTLKGRMLAIIAAVAIAVTATPQELWMTVKAETVSAETVTVATLEELQAALANASVKEVIVANTISLPEGTSLDGGGKMVRVEHPYINENGIVSESGYSTYAVFEIPAGSGGPAVTIANMTIMGGGSDDAKGIWIEAGGICVGADAKLIMTNVTVTRSRRGLSIGRSAVATMKNCNIVRNVADFGGGILCASGTLIMDSCSLSENRSTRLNGGGGAMEINGSGKAYLNNVVIANNCSSEIGGAINNYNASVYLMNSTVTGNVTTASRNCGGGIGINSGGHFCAVNCLFADNYYIHDNTQESSDIGLFSYNPQQIELVHCVYGAIYPQDTTISTINCKTDTAGVAASYRGDGVLSGTSDATTGFSHPVLVAKSGNSNALYVPVSLTGAAASGAIDTYFDYSDTSAVKMSYGASNTPLGDLPAADTSHKVTDFYDTGVRTDGNTIGAANKTGASYVTLKLGDINRIIGGTVTGLSVYGESVQIGSTVNITVTPDDGYLFDGWKVIQGGEQRELSKDLTYSFQATEQFVDSNTNTISIVPAFLEGALEKGAEVKEGAPIEAAAIDNHEAELFKAAGILTEAEKATIIGGADARVWLEIADTNEDAISDIDKAAVIQQAKQALGDDAELVYLDVSLFKQVGNDGQVEQIHDPGMDIQVTIKIPDSLLNHDKTLLREYKIIRLHDGVVAVISGNFDTNTNEFSFKTDKFSTYAIAYSDRKLAVDADTWNTSGNTNSSGASSHLNESVQKAQSPKTGDDRNPVFWGALMMLAIAVLAGLLVKKERPERR